MDSCDSLPTLGVVELSTHENFLADLCTIAADVADLRVFTTDKIRDRVVDRLPAGDDLEWILQDRGDETAAFLSRIETLSETELDVLWAFPFYGTVFDYLHYARFHPACPLVLSAYDLNGWLGRNPVLTPKLYNFLKYPLKRRLLRTVDIMAVEFEPIRDYVGPSIGSTAVRTFSPVYYDGQEGVSVDEETFVLTVPGMIDETRRDYEHVIEGLAHADRTTDASIELVFLGRPIGSYGNRMLERAVDQDWADVSITTFDGWIPTGTFAREIQRSDLLLSPLRRTKQVDGFREEYGRSKGSGAISDAIRHATPLALPEWYPVPECISPGVVQFGSAEALGERIAELGSNPDALAELRDGAEQMSSEYSIDGQRSRLLDILDLAMKA